MLINFLGVSSNYLVNHVSYAYVKNISELIIDKRWEHLKIYNTRTIKFEYGRNMSFSVLKKVQSRKITFYLGTTNITLVDII